MTIKAGNGHDYKPSSFNTYCYPEPAHFQPTLLCTDSLPVTLTTGDNDALILLLHIKQKSHCILSLFIS